MAKGRVAVTPREREINLAVGRAVRLARQRAGLSLDQLGAHVGVTYQQMQKYEKGTNRLSAGKLALLAQRLGVPVEELFGRHAGGNALDVGGATRPGLQAARLLQARGPEIQAALRDLLLAMGPEQGVRP